MKGDIVPPTEELAALLGWLTIPGIGPQQIIKIRDHFGSFFRAWNLTACEDPDWIQFLNKTAAKRSQLDIEEILNNTLITNPQFISILHAQYPRSLITSYPEPILYYQGNIDLLKENNLIAVVGSRRLDHYNANAVKHIFSELVNAPIIIVSGLAYGIDALAHQLALDHNLPTIAVLGSSVADEEIYPRGNFRLAKRIISAGGLLISPFPQGSIMDKYVFPYRNAIIAGLCRATLVASAAVRSGALITAQMATDAGREVWAIPGNIHQELAAGCNKLIQQGAGPITCGNDILQQLRLERRQNTVEQQCNDASEIEQTIINLIKTQPLSVEDLLQKLPNCPTNQLMTALAGMELKNWLEKSSNILRLK